MSETQNQLSGMLMQDPMEPFTLGLGTDNAGESAQMCPFDKMTNEWYDWQRGHRLGIGMYDAGLLSIAAQQTLFSLLIL